MTQTGFDLLIASIHEDAQLKEAQNLEKAHQEGQKLYDRMMEDNHKKCAAKHKKLEARARSIEKFEKKRIQKDAINENERVKQECVASVYGMLEETFQNLDDANMVQLMDNVLQKQSRVKPRILVSSSLYEASLKEFGAVYPVVEDPHITKGFILNYDNYDINMEFEYFFDMQRERLSEMLFEALFGDQSGV